MRTGLCTTGKAILAAGGLLLTHQVLAGGFYISEIGTPGSLGTAGAANVTNNVGADSAFTNPAGMTGLTNDTFVVGMQAVVPYIKFDPSVAEAGGSDGHNAGKFAMIPSTFYVKPLSERLRVGIALTAPMGGGIDYGDSFVGRYAASKTALQALGISPAIAYKFSDRFSLGVGVTMVYTDFEQYISINRSELPGGPFPDGEVRITDATDWGYQPYAGFQYQISDKLLFGAMYRAEADVNLRGDLQFRNTVIDPPANDINVGWDNPQLINLGIRYQYSDDRFLFLSGNWEDWSEFSENRLEVVGGVLNPDITLDRNWDDTWNVSIGYAHLTGEGSGYSFGVSYDSSVVSDGDRTIDLPFDEVFKLSGAYALKSSGEWAYSVGASLFFFGDAAVDQTSQGVRFKGEFDDNMLLFVGFTANYGFVQQMRGKRR